MKLNFLICIYILLTLHPLKGQQNKISPETHSENRDTIRKVVEVVRYEYEYYDAPPFKLYIGTGINISQIKINSDLFNATETHPGIPVNLRLQKGRLYVRTGLQYQNLSFNIPVTETVEELIAHTVTQTVVVDTFYRYNNGNPIENIVTKEIESVEYETVETQRSYNKKRNYTTLQIPLLLGFRKAFNKFSIRVDAGMSLLLFTNKSRNDIKEDYPECNTNFYTYSGGAGVEYAFSEWLNIDCGVHFNKKTNDQHFDFLQENIEFKLYSKIF